MLVPETHFEKILADHGSVSLAQISQGSISQNYIRGLLANKSEADQTFPRLIDGDFLSGSYGRGTKIFPLDDIDVMLVIDGAGFFPIRNGQFWDAKVRASENVDNPLLKQVDWNGLLSSRKVLDHFKRALEKSHPGSKIAKDGQAVNVWLDSYKMGIDVVPCFHIVPSDGSQDVYYIPAGGESDGWMITNPKIDEKISEALHLHHNKKLKPVIKLLKVWNKLHNGERLESYHLETVAWYVFASHPSKIEHYGSALMYFFNNAASLLANSCPDATKLGGPVDAYLTQQDRLLTLTKIQEVQQTLNGTHLLGMASEKHQVSGWRKVYGDQFGAN